MEPIRYVDALNDKYGAWVFHPTAGAKMIAPLGRR